MRLRNIPAAHAAVPANPHVIEEPEIYKNRWSDLFHNSNPVHIEIGMGKGKFITEMAMSHPDINYIGMERYASVLYRALQKREEVCKSENSLHNLFYVCIDAKELLSIFDKRDNVGCIYLNFSDPWPKKRHAKRRLVSQNFLALYEQILSPGGRVEFKTDNKDLFSFALSEIEESKWVLDRCTFDLHYDTEMSMGNIMTEYEEKFSLKGNSIYKLVTHKN